MHVHYFYVLEFEISIKKMLKAVSLDALFTMLPSEAGENLCNFPLCSLQLFDFDFNNMRNARRRGESLMILKNI